MSPQAGGLGDDIVDLAVQAVLDHFLKLGPVLGGGAGDPFIGIDALELPGRVLLDVVFIMGYLQVIAGCLGLFFRGYPAVSADSPFMGGIGFRRGMNGQIHQII